MCQFRCSCSPGATISKARCTNSARLSLIRTSTNARCKTGLTNKLYAHRQALYDEAEKQRRLCRDWLLDKMSGSPEKTQTKNDICVGAIERFQISKSAFERACNST